MTGQKFWQRSDDIKPNDDITPFDGILMIGINLVGFIVRFRTFSDLSSN